jgi:predicted N-acetyltransferase YhbS
MTRDFIRQTVTKQDLIERGVIRQREVDICIRDARPSDRTAIRELTLAAYQDYAEPLGEYWEKFKTDTLQLLEHVSPAQQLVVDNSGDMLGAVLLYPAGQTFTLPDGTTLTTPFPEVRLLAVAASERRRGLGTLLVRECIERAREQKAKAVMLHILKVMPHLAQMYGAMGFVRFPEFDIELPQTVSIECYRLDLEGK